MGHQGPQEGFSVWELWEIDKEEIRHRGLFALLVLYLTVNKLIVANSEGPAIGSCFPKHDNMTTVMTKRYGCGLKFKLIGMNGHEYRGNLEFLMISLHFSFSRVE